MVWMGVRCGCITHAVGEFKTLHRFWGGPYVLPAVDVRGNCTCVQDKLRCNTHKQHTVLFNRLKPYVESVTGR